MESLWPDQIVEDANLTVTMSLLRTALGEKANEHRLIVTIRGRGYRFVGELNPREALIVEQHMVSEILIDDAEQLNEFTATGLAHSKSAGSAAIARQPRAEVVVKKRSRRESDRPQVTMLRSNQLKFVITIITLAA
jgi:hypothetical protein